MAYRVTFTKLADAQAVAERILPALRQRFGAELEADLSKRGRMIRFHDSGVRLAIEIYAGDPESGCCHIDLASTTKRFVFWTRAAGGAQLEEVKRIVAGEIAEWTGKLPDVTPL